MSLVPAPTAAAPIARRANRAGSDVILKNADVVGCRTWLWGAAFDLGEDRFVTFVGRDKVARSFVWRKCNICGNSRFCSFFTLCIEAHSN